MSGDSSDVVLLSKTGKLACWAWSCLSAMVSFAMSHNFQLLTKETHDGARAVVTLAKRRHYCKLCRECGNSTVGERMCVGG